MAGSDRGLCPHLEVSMEIKKLKKKLAKLEKEFEKLVKEDSPGKAIRRARIMKSFNATSVKLAVLER